MNRKAETFFDAITLLREDLVEEAQNYAFRKRRSGWRTFGSLAACIALVASLGVLAILPRGCGASEGSSGGSSSNMNTSLPPSSAASPAEMPPDANGDGAYGGGEPAAAEPVKFAAIVVEIQKDAILVEPIDFDAPNQCLVPVSGLEIPELAEGDWVSIVCTAPVLDTDPPVILGVQSIERADVSQ